MKLCVVIPTLNEHEALPLTLCSLREALGGATVSLIVSDCDSGDGTACLARGLGATVVRGSRCRAEALNRGAAAAPTSTDVLLFLHADTRLPTGFLCRIERALRDPRIVGGAFDHKFAKHPQNILLRRHLLRTVMHLNRIRFRWGRRFYGDQAIFVRRAIFEKIGGFPKLPLLEDAYFCAKLNRAGRTAILSPAVKTSPRRFLERGIIRTFVEDSRLLLLDSIGERPAHLWKRYNDLNRAGHALPLTAPSAPPLTVSGTAPAGGSATSRSPCCPSPSPSEAASPSRRNTSSRR